MVTLDTLARWLNVLAETERLEFKEAKTQFDSEKLMRYCVALANEGGGYLVLGCRRRSKFEPPCRANSEPGLMADRVMVGCG